MIEPVNKRGEWPSYRAKVLGLNKAADFSSIL